MPGQGFRHASHGSVLSTAIHEDAQVLDLATQVLLARQAADRLVPVPTRREEQEQRQAWRPPVGVCPRSRPV